MDFMFIEMMQLIETLAQQNAKLSSCIFTMIRHDGHPDADATSQLYSIKIATLACMDGIVSEMPDDSPIKETLLQEIALCHEYFDNDPLVGHMDIRTMINTHRTECAERDTRVAAGDDILSSIFRSDKG
jgi:hypothetical protein